MLLSLILVGLNALLAASRAALVNTRRPRLRQMQESGVAGAGLAARIVEDSSRLIATVRLAQALCRFFAIGVAVYFLMPATISFLQRSALSAQQAETWALVVLLVVSTLIVLVLGELVPEALAQRDAERWAIVVAPAMAALEWLLASPANLLVRLSAALARPFGGTGNLPLVTEEEIKTLVDAGEEGGVIEQDEKEMIYSIFQFGDTLAREVMVPRVDMVAIEADTPIAQAVETILSAGHSRIPVYQDSIDNVIGVLYAKDLLRVWQSGAEGRGLRELARPAYFVPEAKKLDDLMADLQRRRVHMALVVDEYGGIAGLVTLEDIVEEIIGEVRDEYDVAEEARWERLEDSEYLFDARIDLDDVNELLEAELPKHTADTLGGFVYSVLGKVPVTGERLAAGGLELKVEHVTGRRIRKIRARRIETDTVISDQ